MAGNLNSKPPISGAQIRAARALLKWSVRKLSHQCGISQSAITRSERVNGTPSMQVRNLHAIRQVFEEHGIEFLELDGVRLLARSPRIMCLYAGLAGPKLRVSTAGVMVSVVTEPQTVSA